MAKYLDLLFAMILYIIFFFSIFSWVCDDEQDCGSSPQGTLDVSDEDPVRCRGNVSCSGNQFLCKVSTIPRIESEWGGKIGLSILISRKIS